MGIEPSDGGEIQGPVPERPISANPGLIFFSLFYIYLPMHCLEYHFVLSLLYLIVKAQLYYFVRLSYMVLDKETVIKIWLGLNHKSINQSFILPRYVKELKNLQYPKAHSHAHGCGLTKENHC